MTTRRAVAGRVTLALLMAGPLLGACGSDGGSRLSASAYRERAGAHCRTLQDASDELAKAQTPSATGAQVARYVHRAADGLRDLVHELDALTPPRALEADATKLLDLLASYADGLDRLADHVGPGDTLNDAFDANQQLVARLNRDAGAATTLVSRLQLEGCLLA